MGTTVGAEYVTATEVSLQAAFDTAANRTVGILYGATAYQTTPIPYRECLYPLDEAALAHWLLTIADKYADNTPASADLKTALRNLSDASHIPAYQWYPLLYLGHTPDKFPPDAFLHHTALVQHAYHARLNINHNFDTIFFAMRLLNAMATHASREHGIPIESGIFLAQLEYGLNRYLTALATLGALVPA